MRILFSVCLAACTLYGQPGKLQAPSSGFVFDRSSQTLRRIQGIPGAALVGPAVDFGFPVTAATVSPRSDSAIVLSDDGAAHFFRLTGDSPAETLVDGLAAPERIVFSPSGTAAALYTSGSVQVLKGLPDAAALAATVSVPGRPKVRRPVQEALAISDDGAYLLYQGAGAVELIGVAGDSRTLMDATPGAFAAFAPAGHDAAVIHSGTLTVIQDVLGAATRRDMPGLTSLSAVAFAPDARTVFVASERGRTVSAINVATGDSSPLACDCAPTSLVPMGSLYRLNEMSSAPLWLLDATAAPRLVFVPAKSGN
jgi:hypothetical protein